MRNDTEHSLFVSLCVSTPAAPNYFLFPENSEDKTPSFLRNAQDQHERNANTHTHTPSNTQRSTLW